jgi:tyrosinase
MAAKPKTKTTRYERVREILNRAAGKSQADYGDAGRFWELPLADFKTVEIHGIAMIAPEKEGGGSCCCSGGASKEAAAEPSQPPFPGRGQRSGLIKGLRGESPFDGSKFPRLPWGGKAVAERDIQFISDWIEDGCPERDHLLATFDLPKLEGEPGFQTINEVEQSEPTFATGSGDAADYKFLRGELRQRMNLDCMTPKQVGRLREAFRALYDLNKWPEDRRNYNNQALVHQNHCQHGWERFLPWHRAYLYEFEQTLQDVCPDVTMPYWDWTMPQYRPQKPEKGWIIPEALKGFLTAQSLVNLQHAHPPVPAAEAAKLKPLVNKLFVSPGKFFAAVAEKIGAAYTKGAHRNRFIDELLATNPLWYPLRYPAEYTGADNQPSTINDVIHYHYPTAEDIEQIQSLRTFRDYGGGGLYNDAFGFLDQNPHNTLHIWTGGMNPDYNATPSVPQNRNHGVKVSGRRFHSRNDLYTQPQFGDMFSNLTASYDPVFWPIHANIDRLWWDWQEAHPNAVPAGLDGVLTPWGYTVRDMLDMPQFGYEYVKSSFIIPVGLEAPVSRLVSQPLEVPDFVRKEFRQAEVRLHRVPQLPRSCFIRVFLNLPGANGKTPLSHENYAGYLAVFGHGPCYGGPGHCDLPPEQPRKFDARPRSHNTPRNHRVNVTACAQKLIKQGAKSLQISLVVIGADYREDKELLRLEGVSLNFLD